MLSDQGLQYCSEWLCFDEGFEMFAYDDETGIKVYAPHGKLTIGYGFNLEASGLSMYESLLILKHRIDKLWNAINAVWPEFKKLDETRQLACCNVAYNCGVDGFMAFDEMRLYLGVGDWLAASKASLDSIVAAKEPDRYARIAETLLTGKLPSIIPQVTVS